MSGADHVGLERARRAASLARLQLSEAQLASYAGDLERVLGYIDQLQEVPTDHVAPLVHTTIDATPQREDIAEPTIGAEAALANAPQVAGDCFVVPRVVGGS